MGQVSENPGPIPPRIVTGKDGRTWDNPSAFGKIPAGREEEGRITCQNADFDHATGFHPDARNVYGGAIPRGGFYCVGKRDAKKDSPLSSGNY